VEDAYAAAAKKYFRTKEDLGARFDRDSGALDVFARKKVVDDVTNPDLEITPVDAESMSLPASDEGIVEIMKPREELLQLGRIAPRRRSRSSSRKSGRRSATTSTRSMRAGSAK